MATLAEIGNFYNVSAGLLLDRFLGAVLKECIVILNEAENTPNHAARLVWANAQLTKPKAELLQEAEKHMRWAVAGNATIQGALGASTDSDVEYVVNVQVNAS